MKKLFSQREFVPDAQYIRVLQVITDQQECSTSEVISMLLPEHDIWSVRSAIHQLVLRKYLCEHSTGKEISLAVTETGLGLLRKSTAE